MFPVMPSAAATPAQCRRVLVRLAALTIETADSPRAGSGGVVCTVGKLPLGSVLGKRDIGDIGDLYGPPP
jgi:hypothetical protein